MDKRLPPERQRQQLHEALNSGRKLRVVEAHNAFSAMIASRSNVTIDRHTRQFDGLWVSSLTSSATKGLPDMEIYMIEDRMDTVRDVVRSTDKFVIVDGDTGGDAVSFEYLCPLLERTGVSAIVIEDKRHPKRNSLSESSPQELEEPRIFANKLRRGKESLLTEEFKIFARLEGLIAGATMADTLERAGTYLAAGADGILLHSRDRDARKVFEFAARLRAGQAGNHAGCPLACVPTTYNSVLTEQLFAAGYDIVIYANQLLRASHYAMKTVCDLMLRDDRALACDALCSPVTSIFDETGYTAALSRHLRGDA